MASRSRAREVALQLLYRQDLNPTDNIETAEDFVAERLKDPELRTFCWRLFTGTTEWRKMIDERIEEVAANWSLHRMAPTDRNVLRLGGYELLYTETPNRVVVDESIELAKKFGDAQSPQFVNGILDKLMPDADSRQDNVSEDNAPGNES
jgi:transcription antitermination protein NusB